MFEEAAPSHQQQKSMNTRRSLLDAATVVIARDGVVSLTLQRVASEAGVSKGGLLYHFATKEELVAALLEDTLQQTTERLDALTTSDEPGAFARSYLEFVRDPDHVVSDNATSIFAAAALHEGHLAPAADQFRAWQDRLIEGDGLDDVTALLARVIGDGLWLIDLFGLASPSTEQRAKLIDRVLEIIDTHLDND